MSKLKRRQHRVVRVYTFVGNHMSWLIIISGSAGQELKGNTKLKSSESEMQDINPLYTNGFILLVSGVENS